MPIFNPSGPTIEDQIVDNVTTVAPSQNAVHEALLLKIDKNIGTAKGEIIAYEASNDPRIIAAGTNDYVLTADSTVTGGVKWAEAAGGITDHGDLTGLSDDDHSIYPLLLGRSGGQSLIGGTAASNNLTLTPTSNATKGNVIIVGRLVQGSGNTMGTSNDTFVLGTGNNVQGTSSGAIGTSNVVSGNFGALCIGNSNQATGQGCLAFGISNVSSAIQSICMGTRSYANSGQNGAFVVSDGNPDGVSAGDTAGLADAFTWRFKNGLDFFKNLNTGPKHSIRLNTVATTDGTITTVESFVTASNKSYLMEARVVARRTGGTAGVAGDSAAYIRRVMVKNVAGTVTVSAVQDDLTVEDQAGWDCTIDNSTTTVRVRITGATDNNITWNCTLKIETV